MSVFVSAILFISGTSGLQGADDDKRQPKSQLKKAQSAYDDGDYRKAGRILIGLIKNKKTSDEVYLLLGQSYFQMGQFTKASTAFDKVSIKSLHSDAGYAWGASYYQAEKWQRAIAGFKKVPRKSQYRPFAAYYLGVCYFQLQRYYSAKRLLKKADTKNLIPAMRRNRRKMLSAIQEKRSQDLNDLLSKSKKRAASKRRHNPIEFQPVVYLNNTDLQPYGDKSRSFKYVSVNPEILINQSSLKSNHFGLVEDQLDSLIHQESLGLNLRHPGGAGLFFRVANGQIKTSFSESQLVVIDDASGYFTSRSGENISESYIGGDLEPYFTVSGLDYQVQLALRSSYNLPKEGEKKPWGSHWLLLDMQRSWSSTDLNIELRGGERFDEVEERQTQEYFASLGLYKQWQGLSFELSLDYTQRQGDLAQEQQGDRILLSGLELQPLNSFGNILSSGLSLSGELGALDLEASLFMKQRSGEKEDVIRMKKYDAPEAFSSELAGGELVVGYPLFEGLLVQGRGSYQQGSGFKTLLGNDEDGYELISSNINLVAGAFGVAARPLDWLSIDAQLGQKIYSYEGGASTVRQEFKVQQFDFQSYSTITAKLDYEF